MGVCECVFVCVEEKEVLKAGLSVLYSIHPCYRLSPTTYLAQIMDIFRSTASIAQKLSARAFEWRAEEGQEPEFTDIKGLEHTHPANAASFSLLHFLLDCLQQSSLTVGHYLIGFPTSAFQLRDLMRSHLNRNCLLGTLVFKAVNAGLENIRYCSLALKVGLVILRRKPSVIFGFESLERWRESLR